MLVGYLGPKGSFSHQVAQKAFPEAHLEPYPNITEVIKAYERGQVDLSIVPVENSIEGSVHETLDYLFHQSQIQAVAELIQPIKQQLLGCQTDGPIGTIFSHPQALAQSKTYIQEHYPYVKLEVTASTAAAARLVAEHPEEPYAAIAPETAAEEYGLQLVARDIQEMSENFTRFWVLGPKKPEFALEKLALKKTLGLTLPDNLPGALYKALSVFAWRGIDLTKIESRPLKTALGEYFFIIDVNGEQESLLQFALEELTAIGITYKILGQYSVHLIA
ncbi:prephenate dehydratase [Streptococcus gordonii]|uniref:prephenate dehydratase n=1 Tax=Streptococcus gordonii TaxID=1302 RepID=UPI002283AC7A|nr:prephenate dehydratase [Streptococcus gordonii]MCY7138832.1 prephenate dehydratase [Streptococcus gordonii]